MRQEKFQQQALKHPVLSRLVIELFIERGTRQWIKRAERAIIAQICAIKVLPWGAVDVDQVSREAKLHTLNVDPTLFESVRYLLFGQIRHLNVAGDPDGTREAFMELPNVKASPELDATYGWSAFGIEHPRKLSDLARCWEEPALKSRDAEFKASYLVELTTLSSPSYDVLGYWIRLYPIPPRF